MADDKKTNPIDPALEAAKNELLAKAKKDGKIDQKDIFAALPDTPDNVDILDALYTDMKDALKTAGRKLSDKELAASKNSKTDTALTTAEQNNRFDEEFLVVMNTGLTQYQRTIKKAYEGAKSQKLKSALATQFESANTLAGAASSN